MALKNRIVAFVAGVLVGPAIVWAGLETGTYISDLVATNPLSSDLASTADDHIRLLKSTIKTTFPKLLKRDSALTIFTIFALADHLDWILVGYCTGALVFFVVFFVQFARNAGAVRRALRGDK